MTLTLKVEFNGHLFLEGSPGVKSANLWKKVGGRVWRARSASLHGGLGRSPSGVQGQSSLSGGQGAKPPWSWRHFSLMKANFAWIFDTIMSFYHWRHTAEYQDYCRISKSELTVATTAGWFPGRNICQWASPTEVVCTIQGLIPTLSVHFVYCFICFNSNFCLSKQQLRSDSCHQ
jgi:hypothetical protein